MVLNNFSQFCFLIDALAVIDIAAEVLAIELLIAGLACEIINGLTEKVKSLCVDILTAACVIVAVVTILVEDVELEVYALEAGAVVMVGLFVDSEIGDANRISVGIIDAITWAATATALELMFIPASSREALLIVCE